jgi:hypothetical protein
VRRTKLLKLDLRMVTAALKGKSYLFGKEYIQGGFGDSKVLVFQKEVAINGEGGLLQA